MISIIFGFIKAIPIFGKLVTLLTEVVKRKEFWRLMIVLVLFAGGFFLGTERQKRINVEAVKAAVIESIETHNDNVKTIEKERADIAKKTEIKDKVIYEKLTKTIVSDCDTTELNSVYNETARAINSL